MADNNTSYDEFTLNFRLEEGVPIDQHELTVFNYEFVGNRTTCEVVEVDEQLALQFKIPATLPLEQFLQKQLYKGEFLSILSNILKQLIYFDENLMSFNKLLLNVHYMYIELSTLDIQLIFMPVTKKFRAGITVHRKNCSPARSDALSPSKRPLPFPTPERVFRRSPMRRRKRKKAVSPKRIIITSTPL